MTVRVLIIGASGFIGGELMKVFGEGTSGTYCHTARAGLEELDITREAEVDGLIDDLRPELVIHPAAQPNVDRCETEVEESHQVNVVGTRNVARASARVGARYVYFSTDYLFDGTDGPYEVDAEPAPLSVYGRHKLEAEQTVRELVKNHLIVRVCGVYGYHSEGKNFIMALLAKGRRGERMNVPSDQWGTPTYVVNLAEAVKELALLNCTGVAHPVGPDYLVRTDFALLAAEVLALDPAFLHPMTTEELGQAAARPRKGGVDSRSTQALLKTRLLGAREGLDEFRRATEDRQDRLH